MRYSFTTAQKEEIAEARQKNKEKQTEKRLYALSLKCALAAREGFGLPSK